MEIPPSHLQQECRSVGKRWVTPCDPAENPENSKMCGIFGTVLEAEQVHLLLVYRPCVERN